MENTEQYCNRKTHSNTLQNIVDIHDDVVNEWKDVSTRIRIICKGLQKALDENNKILKEYDTRK